MRAAVVQAPGQTPVYADVPDAIAGSGEVVVMMAASAISHLARGRASGAHYSAAGGFPRVVGVDGVGRLEGGQRVCVVLPRAPHGTMAERTVVPASHCVPLPDELDDISAAALINPGMSSWAALTQRAQIAAGETVLINGATGIAGRLAIAIARHLGAGRVIATGRDAAALAALGADRTILLRGDTTALEAAFIEEIHHGIDIVLDYLWGDSAQALLMAAAKGSDDGVPLRYVQIGSAAGHNIALPATVLRAAAISLMGSGLGSVGRSELIAAIHAMLQAAVPAKLAVATHVVPLNAVADVWAQDDNRRRTVLRIGGTSAG